MIETNMNILYLGAGTHTFKYPDIAVLIDGDVAIGQTTIVPSWYNKCIC